MAEPTSTWEVISNLGREQAELLQQLRDELSATRAALAAETASRRLEADQLRTQLKTAAREEAASLEDALEAERSTRATLGRRLTELARELAEERAARALDSRRLADLECATFGGDSVLMKKNGEIMHYPAAMHVPPPRGPQSYEYAAPPPPPPPPPPRGPPPPRNRTPDIAPDQAWSQEGGTPNSSRIRTKSWQDMDNGGRKQKQRPPRTTSPSQGDEQPQQQQPVRPVAPPTAEQLRQLEDQILVLCDDAPNGSILCANLPRLYYYKFRKTLEFRQLGFIKMSQLLTKMDRVHYDGKHRAEISRKQPNQATVQSHDNPDGQQSGQPEPTPVQGEGHDDPNDDDDDAPRDDHPVAVHDEQVVATDGQADGDNERVVTSDEHESTPDDRGDASDKNAGTNVKRVDEHIDANGKHVGADNNNVGANDKHVGANGKHVGADDKRVGEDDDHVVADDEPVVANDKPVVADDKPVVTDEKHVGADDKHVDANDKPVDTDEEQIAANDKHVDVDDSHPDANNKHTGANDDAQDDGDGCAEAKSSVANDDEEPGAESSSVTTEVIALVTPPAEHQQHVSSKADFDDEGDASTLAHVERNVDDDEPALMTGKQGVAIFEKDDTTVDQSDDPQGAAREDAPLKPPVIARALSWSAVVAGGAKARQISGVASRRSNGAPAPPR